MVKSLCMTLVYCPGLACIQEGWQYHSLIDFQLAVKLDSISLPESSECLTLAVTSSSMCTANVQCLSIHSGTVSQVLVDKQPLSFFFFFVAD